MAFTVKKRGKLTYYAQGERPVLSSLVTEELPDGDLKISFAGLTGGYSAKSVLGLDELVTMDPAREIPLVFACWERWLQEAGICESLRNVDFIEIHAFGCQPKSPNPLRKRTDGTSAFQARTCSAALRFGKRGGLWGLESGGACHRGGGIELVARGHQIDQVGDRGVGCACV